MHLLFILLGCTIDTILRDRIDYAIKYADRFDKSTIDWFLSGGVKNTVYDVESEAEKMKKHIEIIQNYSWNYILDTEATNTAENFIMVNRLLKITNIKYDKILVITSEYHYDRAKKIADRIIINNNFEWILSPLYLHNSYYMERLHMKNVDSDVENALAKIY
jgi:uncharacterized SAM-binding protein YcdF (DUF218 family)